MNFQIVSTYWSSWHKAISDRRQVLEADIVVRTNLGLIHRSIIFQLASIHDLVAARTTPMASPIIRIHFEHLALFSLLLLTESTDDIHQQFNKTNDDGACKDFYWKNFSHRRKVVYTRLRELHEQAFAIHKQNLNYEPANYKKIAEDLNLVLGKYVHPSLVAGLHSALSRRNIDELHKMSQTDPSGIDINTLNAMERERAQIDAVVIKRFLDLTVTFSCVIVFNFFDDPEFLRLHRTALAITDTFMRETISGLLHDDF